MKVQLAQADIKDLAKYANMFYHYRLTSVWSAPECLKHKKVMLEPTAAMDVYSFGLIMWELWHDKIPFDNDVSEAHEVVLNEDQRPFIQEDDREDNVASTVRDSEMD